MKKYGKIEVLETLEEKVNPIHTALIIVDMTNDLVDPKGKTKAVANRPIEHAREIIPNLQSLVKSARESGVLIVHIWHTTLQNHNSDSGPWLDARMRATFSVPDLCLEGTWGQQSIEELPVLDGEIIVKKHRYSAFVGTDLDQILRGHGIKTTVITGVSTNACVEATMRDAFSNEYYVVVPRDTVASWNRELHEATLKTLEHRYGVTCESDEVIQLWPSNLVVSE